MSERAAVAGPKPHAAHEAHHEELGFWRKYVFSTDHKVIGIQYGISGLLFLLFGFSLMMLMRWQLAYSAQPVPLVGHLLERIFGANAPGGVIQPQLYNSFGAMHGTIMVFLGIVPTAFAAFGNYVVPLQIGANDMAFPKLNAASYWSYFVGGVIMMISFFVPGGAAKSGARPRLVEQLLPLWREAKELVGEQLNKMQAALRAHPSDIVRSVAEMGLHAITDGAQVRLQTALMNFDGADEEGKIRAAPAVRKAMADCRSFLQSHQALPLLEQNPLKVTFTVRESWGAALDQIEATLSSLEPAAANA